MKYSMKQLVLFLSLGFFLGVGVSYGVRELRHHERGDRYEKMVERFSEKLNLSSQQEVEVKKLLDDQREKLKAAREEFKPRFEEIREKTHRQIRLILDEGQQKKFDEWESQKAKHRSKKP